MSSVLCSLASIQLMPVGCNFNVDMFEDVLGTLVTDHKDKDNLTDYLHVSQVY